MLVLGYCKRCELVSNTDEGGAVSSDRLAPSYTLLRSLPTSDPEVYDPFTGALTLGTTGPPRAISSFAMFHGRPTNYRRDTMPPRLGLAIQNRQGVRRLLPDVPC
jgi:hypothetical protein